MKQHSQLERRVLVGEKTPHASQSHNTISSCLARYRPKVLIKFPVSELANHHKNSEPKTSLIYMVGNRPYTGKYVSAGPGYSEFTAQPTLYMDASPIVSRSCPLPGLTISMEEKPSCISWKLGHTPGRSLIFTGEGLGPPGKASALQSSIAGVSAGCMHCWLRPPTPLSHRLGRQQQWYSGNPCCWDSGRETLQHRGCSTPFVTSIHSR